MEIKRENMIQSSSYDEHIRILCKCDKHLDEPEDYLDETHFENSEISNYFWDKGFDEAMLLANHFEKENKELRSLLNETIGKLNSLGGSN